MVSKKWREICPSYGLHVSLPDYSGEHLCMGQINGEKDRHYFFSDDDAVDAGPIVGQAEEEIYPTDTIATLYSRIEDLVRFCWKISQKYCRHALGINAG